MAKIRTMTEGHPLKLIFAFSLPLMFGNVFQQFYTVVDTMVVGQALGVGARGRGLAELDGVGDDSGHIPGICHTDGLRIRGWRLQKASAGNRKFGDSGLSWIRGHVSSHAGGCAAGPAAFEYAG